MTTAELCEAAGVSRSAVRVWLEAGLLEADRGGNPSGGCVMVFGAGQLERARLIKQLLRKRVRFAHLAGTDLAAVEGQAYIVFDGSSLRVCRDAAAAIATGPVT
jgi:hypothetical protein